MDIMDAAKQAEKGAPDFACSDIMHWRYERRKLKAARKLLKGEGLPPARRCRLKRWISVYAAPRPGFIGMLSVQVGGLRAPLVEYKGKITEILPEEEFWSMPG
jgi:hypothetical protein